MHVETTSRARRSVPAHTELRQPANSQKLLTTGQVATLTGMSPSWLEKGRIYGWGPKYLRIGSDRKGGAVRYRWSDLLTYLAGCEHDPEEVGQ